MMSVLLLKEFRTKSKLNQRDVADLLQTSQAHYHRLESGKSYPNSLQILKLCEIFSCTPNDLFGFYGDYKVIMDQQDQD